MKKILFFTLCASFLSGCGFMTSLFSRTKIPGLRVYDPSPNCQFTYTRKVDPYALTNMNATMACYCLLPMESEDEVPVIVFMEVEEDFCFTSSEEKEKKGR